MKVHLSGNSLVWSSKGLVFIKELEKNDEILVVGNNSKIKNYRLKMKPQFFGPSSMTRIYTTNNVIEVPQYSKIPTSDMRLKKANEFSDSDEIYFLTNKQCEQISTFTNLLSDKKFSLDIGFCLGASGINSGKNSSIFRFETIDKMNNFHEFLKSKIKPKINGKISYKTANYSSGSYYVDKIGFSIRYDSKEFFNILKEFNLKKDTIPKILRKNNFEFFEKFFQGIVGHETTTSIVQCVELKGSRDEKINSIILDRNNYVCRFFQNMSLVIGKFELWNNPEHIGTSNSYKQKLNVILHLPNRPKPEFLQVIHVDKKIILPTYELEIDDETRPIVDNIAIYPEEISMIKLQNQLDKERLQLLGKKHTDERRKKPEDLSKIRKKQKNSRFLKTISKIEEKSSSVYVIGFIREKTKSEKKQTRKGQTIDFAEAILEDDTGRIPLKLWANFASMFKNGDCVILEDGFSSTFLGKSYITTGNRGTISKI